MTHINEFQQPMKDDIPSNDHEVAAVLYSGGSPLLMKQTTSM